MTIKLEYKKNFSYARMKKKTSNSHLYSLERNKAILLIKETEVESSVLTLRSLFPWGKSAQTQKTGEALYNEWEKIHGKSIAKETGI